MSIRLVVFEVFACALVWSCFCRASFTSKANTRRDVRWAFTYLGVMALLSVFSPFIWGYEPDRFTVALLGSITVIQIVTAYHWRRGVPEPFRKDTQ